MIIKNISGQDMHLGWIGSNGRNLLVGATTEIDDTYTLNPSYRAEKDAGRIEPITYNEDDYDYPVQAEVNLIKEDVADLKAPLKTESIQTINDTPTTIIESSEVEESGQIKVTFILMARSSDGIEHLRLDLSGYFYRNPAGSISQQGSTLVEFDDRSNVLMNADIVADTGTNKVRVDVVGHATKAINWTVNLVELILSAT